MKYNNKAKRSLAAIAASFLLASSLGVTPAHSAQSGAEELLVKETISSASSLPNSDLQNAATLYLLLDLTYSLLENGNGGVRIYENGSEWLILRQAMKNLPETVKQVTTPLIDTIHSIERTPNGLVVTFVSGHSLTIAPEDDLEELSSKLKDIDTQDSSVKSISISPLQRLSDRINTIHRENGSDRFSPPWQPSKTPILPFTADGVKTDGASGVGGNGMKQKIIAFPQESYMSIADRLRSFMTSTQIQGELKKRPLNSLERINGFFDDYKKALEQYNHEGRVANLRAQGRNSEADHLETQRPGPLARTTLYRALVAGEWIEGPQKKWLLLLGDRDLADRLGPFMERSDIREELKTNLLNSIERINGFFDDYKKALEQYNHEGRVANLRAQDQDDKAGHLETQEPGLLARATLYEALVAGGWVRNPREGWQRFFGDRDRAERLQPYFNDNWPYLDHGDDITWEMFREWYLEHRKPLSDFNYTALHSGQKRPEDSKDLTPRTIAMTLHVFQPFSATFLNQLRNYSGHLSYALAYEERLLSLLRTSLSSVRNQSSLSIYQLRRKYLAPNFQDAKLERTQSIQNLKAIVRLKQSWDDLLTGNSPSETLERDAFVSRIARKAHMTFKLSDKLWTYVENPDSYQPNYYQGAPLSNLITQFLVLDSAKELIQQWRDGELPQAADGVKTDGARVVGGNGMSVTVMRSDTVVSTISENKSQDVFSLTHSGRFRMIQTETTPRLHTQPPASLALVVDDSVNDPSLQDQSGNLDFFRFLKGHRRSIYTWSEWRAAYERGEVSETSVGFVLTNEHREELGALVGRRGEDLHWAKEHAHGSIDRFWIVPYHRLPRDVELLEQVREHGYKSLSGNWHDYLIDAVLGEVDNRPVEKGELMYIQEELNESADILFIQA